MDYINSIIMGLIQGLAEFLPVSSSGHLVIWHEIMNFRLQNDLAFDVMLHAGTLVALAIYFFKDIIAYLAAFFKSFSAWNLKNDDRQRLAWYIFLAAIPAGIFGFLLEDKAESSFRSVLLVAGMLILVGFAFLVGERYSRKTRSLKEMTAKNSLVIGLAQILALIPGVSRSGVTILAGMGQGLRREEAARFCFLLSIPVIGGAVVKKISDLFSANLAPNEWLMIALGFLAAFLSGWLAIHFLLKFLQKHSLAVFAYYRFIIGAAVIFYLIFT